MEIVLLTYGDTWGGNILSKQAAESVRYQSYGKKVYNNNKWYRISELHMRDEANGYGKLIAVLEEENQ